MKDSRKLVIKFDRSAEKELTERADRMARRGPPMKLDELDRSIHFLRGVESIANYALPAFYMFISSSVQPIHRSSIEGYPGKVFQSYIHLSSFNNIALTCRKAFDHAIRGGITGAGFAKTNDTVLRNHAEYWAKSSNRLVVDAYRALHLLRSLFKLCAKSSNKLFEQGSTLGRRIGLIKQYADRSAAHLSIEDYAVSGLDIAHVVAALTLVGEIIRSFDRSNASSNYYNDIDSAAHAAAKAIFPDALDLRLFQNIKVEQQARLCWQSGEKEGLQMLLEQLPYAISFF